MAAAPKWVPPLPPGWEGRWDTTQRAYFFINHADKSTTWIDPRFQQPPKPVEVADVKTYGHQQPSSDAQLDATVQKLHRIYPVAKVEIIQDILAGCNNSEATARSMLESFGYRATGGGHLNTTGYAASPKKSPLHTPARSPARTPEPKPAKPKLTDAQKLAILHRLERHNPNQPKDVISMAFEVCEFDETKTKELLKTWDSTSSSRPSTASSSNTRSPSREGRSQASGSTEPVVMGFSLEPVLMDDTPSESSSRKSSASASRKTTTSSRTPTPRSSPARSHQPSVVPSRGKTQPHGSRAKQVTQLSEGLLHNMGFISHLVSTCCRYNQQNSTVTRNNVGSGAVTSQPHSESEYRTQTAGPNPLYRRGPDKELLLPKYVATGGPNPAYRAGPDSSRRAGPQGSTGSDPSMRCGPQSMLLHNIVPHTRREETML